MYLIVGQKLECVLIEYCHGDSYRHYSRGNGVIIRYYQSDMPQTHFVEYHYDSISVRGPYSVGDGDYFYNLEDE